MEHDIYYVHPSPIMIKSDESTNDPVAASSLTCKETSDIQDLQDPRAKDHFFAVKTGVFENWLSADKIYACVREYFCQPLCGEPEPLPSVMRCTAEICELNSFLLKGIQNEAGVRKTIGNPIVDMLCRYMNCKLSLEEVDEFRDAPLNTSAGSRYDYICWRLMFA